MLIPNHNKISALIEQHVFKEKIKVERGFWWVETSPGYVQRPANYSDDIGEAWTIVDYLYDSYRFDTEIQLYEDNYLGKRYRCVIADVDHQENAYTVFAETAPLAICLAALKLSGVDVTEYEHE